MARTRLFRLNTGEKFTWNKKEYTVLNQSERMTEVNDGEKLWAWPSSAIVNIADQVRK